MRHYSYETERSCLGWIKRFIVLYPVTPLYELGASEVEAFSPRSEESHPFYPKSVPQCHDSSVPRNLPERYVPVLNRNGRDHQSPLNPLPPIAPTFLTPFL